MVILAIEPTSQQRLSFPEPNYAPMVILYNLKPDHPLMNHRAIFMSAYLPIVHIAPFRSSPLFLKVSHAPVHHKHPTSRAQSRRSRWSACLDCCLLRRHCFWDRASRSLCRVCFLPGLWSWACWCWPSRRRHLLARLSLPQPVLSERETYMRKGSIIVYSRV